MKTVVEHRQLPLGPSLITIPTRGGAVASCSMTPTAKPPPT
jgi:hypothetical protein